jgi:hypothetical protein
MLSLDVRQTEAVHQEIADLLDQLRRLQDVQVSLEMRLISAPTAFVERILEVKNPEADLAFDPLIFEDPETLQLLQAAQADRRTNLLQAPKITLFSGQTASLAIVSLMPNGSDPSSCAYLAHATVTLDRRAVLLKLAVGKQDVQSILESAVAIQVAAGSSVLLDVTDALENDRHPERESLPWANAPIIRKLLARKADAGRRELLLVTPRILVPEEEEELLGISAR